MSMVHTALSHPALLVAGVVLLVLGVWCWRWSSRHSIDVKGAAIGAALQGARTGKLAVPDDIKNKFDAVAGEASNMKRAQKAGGTVARHFLAKIVGIAGIVSLLAGLAAIAAAFFWK